MFFEVLSLTYHTPITIESLTYRALLGTPEYSSRRAIHIRIGLEQESTQAPGTHS